MILNRFLVFILFVCSAEIFAQNTQSRNKQLDLNNRTLLTIERQGDRYRRFRLVEAGEMIGRGGQGSVYSVSSDSKEQEVVKVFSTSSEMEYRNHYHDFFREITERATERGKFINDIGDDFLVMPTDYFEVIDPTDNSARSKFPAMTFPRMEGNLAQLGRQVGPEEKVEIAKQLQAFWRNLEPYFLNSEYLFTDLKAENIVYKFNPETKRYEFRIIDFDSIINLNSKHISLIFTPTTIPPRFLYDIKRPSENIKIMRFMMGTTLYTLLTGKETFPAVDFDSLPNLAPDELHIRDNFGGVATINNVLSKFQKFYDEELGPELNELNRALGPIKSKRDYQLISAQVVSWLNPNPDRRATYFPKTFRPSRCSQLLKKFFK